MRTAHTLFACLALLAGIVRADVMSVADIRARAKPGDIVEVRGTIVCPVYSKYLFNDASGGMFLAKHCEAQIRIGDVIRATGTVKLRSEHESDYQIFATRIEVIGHDDGATRPLDVTPADIRSAERLRFRLVRVRGTATDLFYDEIDLRWRFLFVERDGVRAILPISERFGKLKLPDNLLDAEIAATGIVIPFPHNCIRAFLAPAVFNYHLDPVEVIRPAPADPFAAAAVTLDPISVDRAVKDGHRHRISGTVIAVSGNRTLLLRPDREKLLRVHLLPGTPAPGPGAHVTVAGFVRNGSFFVQMANAIWRDDGGPADAPEDPVRVEACRILSDETGRPRIDYTMEGKVVRIRGRIKDVSLSAKDGIRLLVGSGAVTFIAEAGQVPAPEIGSTVDVSGVCLIDEAPGPGDPAITHLTGFTLVLRDGRDLVVVRRPPWWTPARLAVLAAVLAALVVAVLVWNRMLQRLAVRRGRELMRESIARAEEGLRVEERQQLAVELHDSIAQNLTGVSMQMEAVEQAQREGSPSLGPLIRAARRTLDSCCTELRDHLWDLRNNSLEDRDVSDAVRKALEPHLADCQADIRLDLPRSRLSDSTFHSILCIIRELAVNAVRHGQAKHVSVSGGIAADGIRFTVRDDGRGFDPAHRPGVAEGHFGLQGVAERLRRLGGRLEMDCAPGRGSEMKVTIES